MKNQIIGRATEGCLQHVSGFSHRAKQWLVKPNENQMSAARHKFTDILVWTPPLHHPYLSGWVNHLSKI